ncbi:RHS repeat-associated core domain-containing protein [Pseudomonas sp. LB3P81]
MPTNSRKTILLATDRQNSVLNALDENMNRAVTYTPYGESPWGDDPQSQLRFNGELRELMTGHYPLGNGYRMYSPILMRFICPDSWSPFGAGWLNAYVYCGCDPINRQDPTGHAFFSTLRKFVSQSLFDNSPRPGQVDRIAKKLTDKFTISEPTPVRYSRVKNNGFNLELQQLDYTIKAQHIQPNGNNFIKRTQAATQELTFTKEQSIKVNYGNETHSVGKSRITNVSLNPDAHYTSPHKVDFINTKIKTSTRSSISFKQLIKYNKVSHGNMTHYQQSIREI